MFVDRFRDRHEQHAGLGQFRLERGGDRNRIEHGIDRDASQRGAVLRFLAILPDVVARLLDAEQRFALAQRNAELFVGAQNLGVDLVERFWPVLLLRRRVVVEVLIVDRAVLDLGPFRLLHGQPALIGVEPPGEHPVRLALLARDETHRVHRQALRGLVGFDQRLKTILVLIDVDAPDLIDGLLYCRHSSLRSRFQGPRVGFVGYGRCPVSGHPIYGRLNGSNRPGIRSVMQPVRLPCLPRP